MKWLLTGEYVYMSVMNAHTSIDSESISNQYISVYPDGVAINLRMAEKRDILIVKRKQ